MQRRFTRRCVIDKFPLRWRRPLQIELQSPHRLPLATSSQFTRHDICFRLLSRRTSTSRPEELMPPAFDDYAFLNAKAVMHSRAPATYGRDVGALIL